jgi:predicted adenylyl cyclase CyaB
MPSRPRPRQNVELKVRLPDLRQARRVAQRVATSQLESEHQIDTYFQVREGRLKLREIEGGSSVLIWYTRADQTGPKRSDYHLVTVADAAGLKLALTAACGLRGVVDKRREIYLSHNVRIHLDRVRGLGHFLEFEAVLERGVAVSTGHRQVRDLMVQFELNESQLVSNSYIDLLARK